jgi:hypothetical protein
MRAPSKRDAARRSRRARSCAASMRRPATLRVQLPRPRPSSDHAVSANAPRCCLPPQAHPAPRPTATARTARRPIRVHVRRHRPESAPSRQIDGAAPAPGRCVCCVASGSVEVVWRALVSERHSRRSGWSERQQGAASTLYETLRRSRWELLQRNRPKRDLGGSPTEFWGWTGHVGLSSGLGVGIYEFTA